MTDMVLWEAKWLPVCPGLMLQCFGWLLTCCGLLLDGCWGVQCLIEFSGLLLSYSEWLLECCRWLLGHGCVVAKVFYFIYLFIVN